MDREGDQLRALTPGQERVSSPRYASDGTRIYFASTREGGGAFVLELATGKIQRVAAGSYSGLDVSPDGQRLALTSEQPPGLLTVELATGQMTWLVEKQRFLSSPRFSPDGRWIIYAPFLKVVASAGGTPVPLTHDKLTFQMAAFDRTSAELVVVARDKEAGKVLGGMHEIYRVKLEPPPIPQAQELQAPDGAGR
jgi:Tol biopolymer transport system component